MHCLRISTAVSSSYSCKIRYQPPPAAAAAAVRYCCSHTTQQSAYSVAVGRSNDSRMVASDTTTSSSSSKRRLLVMGAALFSANAGVTPWSSAATPAAAAAVRTAAMSTAAAAAAGGQDAGTGVIVVYVTAPSSEVAEKIASSLVEQQMVACVNITPGITSVYRWQGKLEKDSEVLMIMKTRLSVLDKLTHKVKELHPYDEPEVIAMPVVGGSSSYINWVKENTQAVE